MQILYKQFLISTRQCKMWFNSVLMMEWEITGVKVDLLYIDGDSKVNPATKTHSPSQRSQPLRYAFPSVHSNSEWTPGAYTPTDHRNATAIFFNLSSMVSKYSSSWTLYTESLVNSDHTCKL